MAFGNFTFPQVKEQLGLKVEDADLFSQVPPMPVREEIAAFVKDGVDLALANSTEKAKSEFIIAPVLLELRRSLGPKFVLFSGVDWTVDAERGLTGVCDFLLGRGPSKHILEAPFVAVVEAKNDLIHTGLGQCMAAMYAAWIANERAGTTRSAVYGVVSTGISWQFLQLKGQQVVMDLPEYLIDNLPKIMGILRWIVESP